MKPIRSRIIGRLKSAAPPIVVAVALVSVAAVVGTTPQAHAATTATPVYTESLGGQNVNICSNSNKEADGTLDGNLSTCGGQTNVGNVVGAYWQCVEFAQRLYTYEGWHSGVFTGVPDGAYEIYTTAAAPGNSNGFTRQANGSITSLVPGDMIVHGTSDIYSPGAGHVAVVDHISSDGKTVYVVQQNAPYAATYTFSGGTLTGGSGTDILGVVHSTNDHLTNSGTFGYTTPEIFTLDSSGNLNVKVGAIGATWTALDSGIVAFQASSTRIAALDSSGNLWVKESVYSPWVNVASGVSPGDFAVTSDMVVVLWGTNLEAKVGSLSATWTTILNPVQSFAVSAGDHIAAKLTSGDLDVQWGPVGAGWVDVASGVGQYGITDDMVSALFGTNLESKVGSVGATWTLILNPVQSFAVSAGDHIAAEMTTTDLDVQWGPVGAGWVDVTSGMDGYAISDGRVGIIWQGQVWVKDGGVYAPWTEVSTGQLAFAMV